MEHLTEKQLIELSTAITKRDIKAQEICNKIKEKVQKLAQRNPYISESELKAYSDELFDKVDFPYLTIYEAEMENHMHNCFHCRNKLNKMMSIEEDLIKIRA